MAAYLNSDGLYWKTGQTEGTEILVGEYNTDAFHVVQGSILLASLGTGATILSDTVTIPIGAKIEQVELVAETVAATGSVFNLGLVRLDRTTAIDIDGLAAAVTLASVDSLTADPKLTLVQGSPFAGALIGTVLTNPGLLVADYDTTAFTAGKVMFRVRWYKP